MLFKVCDRCGENEVEESEYTKCELCLEITSAYDRANKVENELRNFLDAFDSYFEYRGTSGIQASAIHDAKQAMFSAAQQAREALGRYEKG